MAQTFIHKALKLIEDEQDLEGFLKSTSNVPEIINEKDEHGDSLLHFAARAHQLPVVKLLVETYKADTEAVNEHGRRPLHEAIDNIDCVRYLVKECKVDVNAMKRGDWTPVMIAAMKGNLEIVQMLVESGALLDRQTKDGRTALYLAVQEGHVDVVEYLTDQYPKALLIETNSGRLPTQAAAALSSPLSKEGYEITRYLLSHSSGLTINDDGSNSLIGHRDKSGRDILLDATVSQNLELLQFLLNQGGADANDIDSLGRTMMHHAAIMGHLDVLKLLSKIEGELQWNATDTWDSWTPLMHAAKEGHEEVVRYLVEVIKVETYQKDKQGRTAKDLAGLWKHDNIVQYLSS